MRGGGVFTLKYTTGNKLISPPVQAVHACLLDKSVTRFGSTAAHYIESHAMGIDMACHGTAMNHATWHCHDTAAIGVISR